MSLLYLKIIKNIFSYGTCSTKAATVNFKEIENAKNVHSKVFVL